MGTEVAGHLRPPQNTVAAGVQGGLTHPPGLQRNYPVVAARNKHPGGALTKSKLTFRSYISQLARTAAGKLASLRKISWLLDCKGRQLLYKAQIRYSLEYACLAWGEAAPSHFSPFDMIQRRAVRIIWEYEWEPRMPLDNLQHRRDVAGLTTLYKVQQCSASPLTQLREPMHRVEVNM